VLFSDKETTAENCILKEKFSLDVAHYCPAWDGYSILNEAPVTKSASDIGAKGFIT
jgi:hypothetical protein